MNQPSDTRYGVESAYAWTRLLASLLLMTIGSVGMYAAAVVLPAMQKDFGVVRGDASLPYTVTLIGFGIGGVLMGRLADRLGVMVPVMLGAVGLGLGFVAAGFSTSLWQFALAHGVLIGLLGISATFAPLVADTSQWFTRRRGIAVAICMSGNYLAGVVWPPTMQMFIDSVGWRQTYVGLGIFCVVAMLPLALLLRRPPPRLAAAQSGPASASGMRTARFVGRSDPARPLGLSPAVLQLLHRCLGGFQRGRQPVGAGSRNTGYRHAVLLLVDIGPLAVAGSIATLSSSHPPLKPARRSPAAMGGQPRIHCHSKPERWFSIIKTIGPWLSPKCHGDTHQP